MNTIALIFDFDDTLLPDSTSQLVKKHGIDPDQFWTKDAKYLLDQGYEPTLAYLNLILDNVGESKPLGRLTPEKLRQFGSTLDDQYYNGLKTLFRDLRGIVSETSPDLAIEFYVISGGLQDVMLGSQLIADNFTAVYGCEFGTENGGIIKNIKRAITFTEKTRYLFEINKGIKPTDTCKNKYAVNIDVPEGTRRIPLKNMIYVGDGLTDIPCFSLLKKAGGTGFGVFQPGDEKSARRAFLDFLKTGRVLSTHSPQYGRKADLGSLLRSAVRAIASRIIADRGQAELGM